MEKFRSKDYIEMIASDNDISIMTLATRCSIPHHKMWQIIHDGRKITRQEAEAIQEHFSFSANVLMKTDGDK